MNVPDLLRKGGWRQGHSDGGAAYWEHQRYGLARWETNSAVADELQRVSQQRDLLQSQLDRALELMAEAAPALLQGASELRKVIARATGATRPSWLVKDFHVLYASARALVEACNGRGDGRPYPPLRELEAQLERLRPAFDETEAMRAELARGKAGG